MIVSLEGIDNSGKTIQAKLIADKLSNEGYSVTISNELTTNIGGLLKYSFKGVPYSPILKTLLFAADRQERLEHLSSQLQNESNIVIFDRYIHSALAYRLSEGIDESWIVSVNKNVQPIDVGFYIDIPSQLSIQRNNTKKENINYSQHQLDLIRDRYLLFVERKELYLIDGLKEKYEITEMIVERIINEYIKKKL